MKTDKALLKYGNEPQWKKVHQLLEPFCKKVVISINEKQGEDWAKENKCYFTEEDIANLDMEFWKNIQSHVNDNSVLSKTELLERLNKNFALFNIPNIVKNVPTATDADDLPF